MTSLWFKVLLCSLPPFYFVVHFTNKQYIFIDTSKTGPSTLGPLAKPQIEIHVQKSEDEMSLERQVLNTAGRHASHPSHPGEPAGYSAPGCLAYFCKRCLSSKCPLSCNFGSSIRLCVCRSLSGGGKRLWLLTNSTE